jgi:hypothetical protein
MNPLIEVDSYSLRNQNHITVSFLFIFSGCDAAVNISSRFYATPPLLILEPGIAHARICQNHPSAPHHPPPAPAFPQLPLPSLFPAVHVAAIFCVVFEQARITNTVLFKAAFRTLATPL